eukprot:g1983.t1
MKVDDPSIFQSEGFRRAVDELGVKIPKTPSLRTADDERRYQAWAKTHPNKYELEEKVQEAAKAANASRAARAAAGLPPGVSPAANFTAAAKGAAPAGAGAGAAASAAALLPPPVAAASNRSRPLSASDTIGGVNTGPSLAPIPADEALKLSKLDEVIAQSTYAADGIADDAAVEKAVSNAWAKMHVKHDCWVWGKCG